MQDLFVALSLGSVMGLLFCFGLRDQFKTWGRQSTLMKTILFILAFNTAVVVLGLLVVLSAKLG